MFTYKALGLIWLIIFALFAVSGLGVVADSWVLPLVVAALVAGFIMALNVGPRATVKPTATLPAHAPAPSDVWDRAPLDLPGIDVYRWENDGGAAGVGFGRKYAKSPDPV